MNAQTEEKNQHIQGERVGVIYVSRDLCMYPTSSPGPTLSLSAQPQAQGPGQGQGPGLSRVWLLDTPSEWLIKGCRSQTNV